MGVSLVVRVPKKKDFYKRISLVVVMNGSTDLNGKKTHETEGKEDRR